MLSNMQCSAKQLKQSYMCPCVALELKMVS